MLNILSTNYLFVITTLKSISNELETKSLHSVFAKSAIMCYYMHITNKGACANANRWIYPQLFENRDSK